VTPAHAPHPRPLHIDLGNDEPLYIKSIRQGPPDRRRVSLRWLGGSVLTAVFSIALVGGALEAAIGHGETGIVRPALAVALPGNLTASVDGKSKGDRVRPEPQAETFRRVIQVSTVTRMDDRDLIKVRPFAHVRTGVALPVAPEIAEAVPPFNPLAIFADGGEPVAPASSDSIYAANVDGEVTIKVSDFRADSLLFDESVAMPVAEVEQAVRDAAPFLAEGAIQLASLPAVDPARFQYASADPTALASLAVAIVPENVSFIEKSDELVSEPQIEEKIVTVARGDALADLLTKAGATTDEARQIQSALVANFSFNFRAGQTLRLGLAGDDDGRVRPVRLSLYDGNAHLATVALSDGGIFVAAAEPVPDAEIFAENETAEVISGKLPSVYSAIWRSGLALDMPTSLVKDLVQIFSFDVDFQSRVTAPDTLEVIYSADEDNPDMAEILFASLSLAGQRRNFYRYRTDDDGTVDYYDETGKSAKKFLMRKPMASGRFRSAFGMRRHPILGRYKMHTGVDWAAPRGTPIMAAGNGTFVYAGWKSGYGYHIKIRHTNGYETTYSHMKGLASGSREGARVRQGQVIGYVGSTGLSTGPHLHYEVSVNNRFVDPMKIRLPRGRVLKGEVLSDFRTERDRIDTLLERDGDPQRFAEARG
jgi:murein DD-endopeptidase MepM/ murein hydrolase activator NlpD